MHWCLLLTALPFGVCKIFAYMGSEFLWPEVGYTLIYSFSLVVSKSAGLCCFLGPSVGGQGVKCIFALILCVCIIERIFLNVVIYYDTLPLS